MKNQTNQITIEQRSIKQIYGAFFMQDRTVIDVDGTDVVLLDKGMYCDRTDLVDFISSTKPEDIASIGHQEIGAEAAIFVIWNDGTEDEISDLKSVQNLFK